MSKSVSYKYRRPRKADGGSNVKEAWWYMSPNQIQVYIESDDGKVRSCVIRKSALKGLFQP